MKKNIVLMLSLLAILALVVSSLSSCSGNNTTSANNDSTNNDASSARPEENLVPTLTVSAAEWKAAFGFFKNHSNFTVSVDFTQKWIYENGDFSSECEKMTCLCTDGTQLTQSTCEYIGDGEEYGETLSASYSLDTINDFDDLDPYTVFSTLKNYADYGFSKFEYNETTQLYSAKINIDNVVYSMDLKFENKQISECLIEREKEEYENYIMAEELHILIYNVNKTETVVFPMSDIIEGIDNSLEKLLTAKSYRSAGIANQNPSEVILALYNFLNNIDMNGISYYSIYDVSEPQGQRSYEFNYNGVSTNFLGSPILYDSVSIHLNSNGFIYMVCMGDSLIILLEY